MTDEFNDLINREDTDWVNPRLHLLSAVLFPKLVKKFPGKTDENKTMPWNMRPCFACGKPTEIEYGKVQALRPAMYYYPNMPESRSTEQDPDGELYEEDMRRYNEETAKLKKEHRKEMLEVHKHNDPYCGCLDNQPEHMTIPPLTVKDEERHEQIIPPTATECKTRDIGNMGKLPQNFTNQEIEEML